MNCHELSQQKILVFWGQKCGATCIKEILMHIESDGTFFDNGGSDHLTHQIYEKFYERPPNYECLECYKDYSIVFFGRNPYHRIISLYLDKYVATNSPSPKIKQNINTFKEFIDHMYTLGFSSERSEAEIFDGFYPITGDNTHWFFEQLNKQKLSVDYFILPNFCLPDGKLIHDNKNLQKLYNLANKQDLFDQISIRLTEGWTHKINCFKLDINAFHDFTSTNSKMLCELTINELRQILKTIKVDAANFFTPELIDKFNSLYRMEFLFYSKHGIDFKVNT